MTSRIKGLALGLFLIGTGGARAHHGLDYMLLQDGTAPGLFSVMPFAAADFSRGDYGDEIGLEGGFLMGLGNDIGLGASVAFMDEEGLDWQYASVSPYLSFPILKTEAIPWLRVSFYAGYQFAPEADPVFREEIRYETVTQTVNASGQVVTTSSSPARKTSSSKSASSGKSARHTGGGGGGTGPDAPTGHDHPVAAGPVVTQNQTTTQRVRVPVVKRIQESPYAYATGIHRHGEEGMTARLIASIDLTDSDQILMNFINFTPRHGHVGWGYAVGYRHTFGHDLAVSLEAIGDFDSTADHEVLAAVHYEVMHGMVLKLGAGVGVGEEAADFVLNTGMVLRF